jgi:hypothetical protein
LFSMKQPIPFGGVHMAIEAFDEYQPSDFRLKRLHFVVFSLD